MKLNSTKHAVKSGIVASAAIILSACAAPAENLAGSSESTVSKPELSDESLCLESGPQTPRDITSAYGLNSIQFEKAPPAAAMNLCNVHTHTNAEHKGPGFSVFVNDSDYGGYACNDTANLTAAELEPAPGAYGNVKSGDTIEVHWVHTTCESSPGAGLGACVPQTCENPLLRVEAQTFLLVNDSGALDFMDLAYDAPADGGRPQAKSIPRDTGTPIEFLGSTTGPGYTQSTCSPAQVTWSVRPMCSKLDINSLHRWAESGNVFEEMKSHGVRQLVTAPELLSPIE